MSGNPHYPRLATLLPIDQIPNELEALKDTLFSVFDGLFVDNLIIGKSDFEFPDPLTL